MKNGTRLQAVPHLIIPTRPLWFQCQCGHREFAISGFTQGDGLKLNQIVCTRQGCNRQYKLDSKGQLGGFVTGKTTEIIPPKQKEAG